MENQPNEFMIVIKLKPNGQIELSGPLQQKILCLGVLKMAENIVLHHQVKPSVVMPTPAMTQQINKGKP